MYSGRVLTEIVSGVGQCKNMQDELKSWNEEWWFSHGLMEGYSGGGCLAKLAPISRG
jgi:hypothetical protein